MYLNEVSNGEMLRQIMVRIKHSIIILLAGEKWVSLTKYVQALLLIRVFQSSFKLMRYYLEA